MKYTVICRKCGAEMAPEWVGYTERAFRRRVHPIPDVARCTACGATWWYARTGRHMPIRRYATAPRP